jgi:hypothetical protein
LCPFFFKCIVIVKGSFICVFHTCISCTLIRSTPLLVTLSLSHCSPIMQQLTVHEKGALRFNVLHSLSFCFPLSPPCSPLRLIHSCQKKGQSFFIIHLFRCA